jgi:aldehyde:ferredoxin oxidoreductase
VGDPSVEGKIFSAVTGRDVDEEGFYLIGERIFNLRRAIALRERGGRESDTIPESMFTAGLGESGDNPKCLAPGKNGEVICLKGAVVDREKFERMKDEYYQLRGWDISTGLQTRSKLEALKLHDAAGDLAQRGLLGDEVIP